MTFLPTPNICLRKSPYSTLAFLLCKGRALISRFLKKNLEKRGGRYICVPLAEYKPKYTLIMKKLFAILTSVLAIAIGCIFVSCSKEDLSKSLEGTIWTATETEGGYILNYTLDFQKSTFSLSVKTVDGSLSESVTITGVYTYDDPIVTLIATFDDETQTINGVRDGDTIGFTDGPTFKKK